MSYPLINETVSREVIGEDFEGGNIVVTSATEIYLSPGKYEFYNSATRMVYIANNVANITIALNGVKQLGTWGNGSQYIYLGYNPTTNDLTVFASNVLNPTPPAGYLLRFWMPLYVESSIIKAGTHNAKLRKFIYDTDWFTTINPVTTAGGGLISVGVPIYPLTIHAFCGSGFMEGAKPSTAASRFSRNSANTTPAITASRFYEAGYDADVSAYYDVNGYVMAFFAGDLYTTTAQIRTIRTGTYIINPTFRVSGYSWSK